MNRHLASIFKYKPLWRNVFVNEHSDSCLTYIKRSYHLSLLNFSKSHPKQDYQNQSKVIQGSDVRLSRLCPGEEPVLTTRGLEHCKTVYDIFLHGVKISGERPFLGWRPDQDADYEWITYNEVKKRSSAFGKGLVELGLQPKNDTRIGLYAQNTKENVIAEFGLMENSMCSVPIYNTVEQKNLTYIINHADITVIACDANSKIEKLLKLRGDLPDLRTIICYEKVKTENVKVAKDVGIDVLHIEEVEKLGDGSKESINPRRSKQSTNLPKPDDLATVCFTSGTTGQPKGVMLSHENLVASVFGLLSHLDLCDIRLIPEDTIISFLPTAHIYQRFLEIGVIGRGAKIGYWWGDTGRIVEDCKALKPTILPSVPRLLNRVHDRTLAHVHKSLLHKKLMFNFALWMKLKQLQSSDIRNNTWFDRKVFKVVTDNFGGKVRVVCTGSAPVSAKVLANLQCILGCPIIEGYGLTECSGLAAATIKGDPKSGHVGPPTTTTLIKLVDVPEMDYYVKNNQGEICLKGPTIFKGYLKKPDKDKEVFIEDNWIRTGDIGTWTKAGCLKITDRRKHIFKLSQGMFIAPEKIENRILRSEYVAQVFVYGDGFRDDIVCIAVPDDVAIGELKNKLRLAGTYDEILHNEKIKKAVLEDLQRISKESRLNNLETVKDVYLHPEDFSTDNGLLTPTMKLKRSTAKERFQNQLDEMFKKLDDAALKKRLSRESLISGD